MRRADDDAAATVHRVAALVAGGLPLERAWSVLGTDAAAVGALVDGRSAAGGRGAAGGRSAAGGRGAAGGRTRMDERGAGRRGGAAGGGLIAAVLAVAEETGAPMAPTLERLAGLLREQAAQRRALEAALAGPRATAKLVMVLPIVGLGFGLALGLDVLGAAVGGGIGTWSMLAGAALLVAAWAWSRAIVRRAARGDPAPGLALDLVAVALAGGGATGRARQVAAAALADAGVEASGWDEVDTALELARRAGVPVRGLLLAEASAARVRARLDGEAKAERAAVQLALPLGACVLPAFSLLVIVPLVVSMLEGALAPLA